MAVCAIRHAFAFPSIEHTQDTQRTHTEDTHRTHRGHSATHSSTHVELVPHPLSNTHRTHAGHTEDTHTGHTELHSYEHIELHSHEHIARLLLPIRRVFPKHLKKTLGF